MQSPAIYGITDTRLMPDERLYEKVEQAIRAGVSWIQYRAKATQPDTKFAQASRLLELCKAYDACLLINDDVSLAKKIGAHGVHLGQKDMPIDKARMALGENAIIGATCHSSLELAEQAVKHGASYVAFGRFFASKTKPDAPTAALEILAAARQRFSVPVIAIGGIQANNARRLFSAGAHTLACCHSLFADDNVESRCQQLLELKTTANKSD